MKTSELDLNLSRIDIQRVQIREGANKSTSDRLERIQDTVSVGKIPDTPITYKSSQSNANPDAQANSENKIKQSVVQDKTISPDDYSLYLDLEKMKGVSTKIPHFDARLFGDVLAGCDNIDDIVSILEWGKNQTDEDFLLTKFVNLIVTCPIEKILGCSYLKVDLKLKIHPNGGNFQGKNITYPFYEFEVQGKQKFGIYKKEPQSSKNFN